MSIFSNRKLLKRVVVQCVHLSHFCFPFGRTSLLKTNTMKNIFVVFTGIILIASTSCNNASEKSSDSDNTSKVNSSTSEDEKQNPSKGSAVIPAGMENILGEWKLDRRVRDDNDNHKIDGEEEKTAIMNPGGYLKFNADGTCKFETVMDGTYEIITEEEGKKRLVIKDLSGTPYPMPQYIVSVTDKELVINNVNSGSAFDIYKRP